VPPTPTTAADPPGTLPTPVGLHAPAGADAAPGGSAVFTSFAGTTPPARGPPGESPVRPCSGGGASHSGRGDVAPFPSPGEDDATRRAALLLDTGSCTSACILDALGRPG
jgi:hypothetical protein